MRTKHEETSATPGTSPTSPGLPTTTASIPLQARRSEVRCLQDLGDLRQLFTSYPRPLMHIENDPDGEIANFLDGALGTVVQETMVWARRHEADGRYRDAEYLFRRVSSNENVPMESVEPYRNEDVLPTLVSIYEKMGDYPAAEMAQETLLRRLFATNPKQVSDEQTRAVCAYSRMLFNFQRRIDHLSFDLETMIGVYIDLFIGYRVAVLDISLLNEVSLEQGLIPIGPRNRIFFHMAVKEKAINLASLLIEKGADVNSRDPRSRTPLHIAVEYAEPAMIELLLANGAEIQVKDKYGKSPLHAALTGNSDEQTLSLIVNAQADMDARDELGRTALFTAVEDDLLAAARFLLQHGANAEVSDNSGETLLLTAVRTGKEWATELLLEKGANLEGTNAQGKRALNVAVEGAQESITQILLDHGADTNSAQDSVYTAPVLHCAVRAGNVAIVELLLKAHANIYERDSMGNTALHRAVMGGQEPHGRIVQLLLDFDAVQMDSVNFDGDTVLHLAATYISRSMTLILVRHIKPDKLPTMCQIRNSLGQTPLDVARVLAKNAKESSDERSVLFLLKNALELSHSFIKNKN